jgi:uncharacterized protein
MYEQLPTLLELQKIDSEIDKLETLKAVEPAKLRALETELSKHREKTETKSKEIEELQKGQRELQRQLSIQQAKIDKYKTQRATVKTNKEYSALELEISESEKSNSETEEEILKLMISLDKAEGELKLAQEEFRNQEDIFHKSEEIIILEVKKLNRKIAKWSKRRTEFTSKINQSLMTRYDNWRKRKKTDFIAVIKGQACGGCHLTLPPQLINEVRKKRELLTCNSCGRVLYWMEDEIPDEDPVTQK